MANDNDASKKILKSSAQIQDTLFDFIDKKLLISNYDSDY